MQWRRTTASGGEELVADYLDLLVSALQARGLSYTPVATVATADLTVAGGGGDVYRLTDREAILVRAGLATSAVTTGTFVAHRTVSIGGTPVAYPRGWVSVLADIGGKPLRVVSTHLDSVDPAAQRDQAAELLHVAGAGPVAVIGGLGADPADTRWAGYAIILAPATGFMDAVSSAGAAFPTCCRDAALVDPAAVLDRRMDFILASPELMGRSGSRVHGDAAAMVNGLWPSTHAGVVGQLEFR
jgi:endonuclease/exonuclease/phosphatase family metal-dependent hydrolase